MAGTSIETETGHNYGCEHADSLDLEFFAIFLAIVHIMRTSSHFPQHVERYIWHDNLSAGKHTAAEWNVTRNSPIALACREARRCASFHTHITFGHVKAHSGHPWNEAADILSKGISRHFLWMSTLPSSELQHATSNEEGAKWWWVHTPLRDAQYPTFDSTRNCFWIDQASRTPLLRIGEPPSVTDTFHSLRINAKVATTNVLTLNDKKGTPARHWKDRYAEHSGREEALREQFYRQNYHIVGIQEHRQAEGTTQKDHRWHIYQSGADSSGNYGCAVWLNKDQPIAVTTEGQPVYFCNTKVVVLHSQPRLLIVRVKGHGICLDVCSFHAPHKHNAQMKHWWQSMRATVLGRPNPQPLLCLCDCNARVGSMPSAHIGTHSAEEECESGYELHTFLQEADLVAPSTFQKWHKGSSCTFIGAKQWEARIDYVLIPREWVAEEFHTAQHEDQVPTIESFVDTQIHVATDREDHSVTSLTFQVDSVTYTNPTLVGEHDRRLGYSRGDLHDPAKFSPFILDLISNRPKVPTAAEVNDHNAYVTRHVVDFLSDAFPLKKRRKRQSYIQEDSWAIIEDCKRFQQNNKTATKDFKHATARLYFYKWSVQHRNWHMFNAVTWRPKLRELRRMHKNASFRLFATIQVCHQLQHMKRRYVAQDYMHQIDILAQRAHQADEDTLTRNRVLHKALKPFTDRKSKKKPRPKMQPLPCLKMPDGTPPSDPSDIPLAWATHTSTIEMGTFTTLPQLLTDNLHRISCRESLPLLHHRNVPTPYDTERYFACTKKYKAYDNSSIVGDILALAPSPLTQIYHPLHFKVTTVIQHPLSYKGGENVRLYKGSGDSNDPASSRSILIADVVGKRLQTFYRRNLLTGLDNSTGSFSHFLDAQSAGQRGVSTDFISHIPRLLFKVAHAAKCSAGAIFLDIKGAFYSIIRHQILKSQAEPSDELIAFLLKTLDIGPEYMDEFRTYVERHRPEVFDTAADDHLDALISDVYSETYVTHKGLGGIMRTDMGSRPGLPLADVLFGFVMRHVLNNALRRLRALDIHVNLPMSSNGALLGSERNKIVPCNNSAWADDDVILFISKPPQEIIAHMSIALAILKQAFLLHGLRLNMKPNKTAGMFSLRYKDAQLISHHFLVKQQGKLYFEDQYRPDPDDYPAQDYALACRIMDNLRLPVEQWSLHQPIQQDVQDTDSPGCLHLVFDYLHMGSYMDSKGSMQREVTHRTAQGASAQRPLNSKIIANTKIRLDTRKYLHAAYCLSRTLYNSQTWPQLTKACTKKFSTKINLGYRRMLNMQVLHEGSSTVGDYEMLAMHDLPDSTLMLTANRLRYAYRLLHDAPDCLIALLQEEHALSPSDSWISLHLQDLEWLRNTHTKLLQFAPPESDYAPWFSLMQRSSKRKWVKIVKQAKDTQLLKNRVRAEAERFEIEFFRLSTSCGIRRSDLNPTTSLTAKLHHCPECGISKNTYQALQAHRTLKHAYIIPARLYATDTTCPCCKVDFHTRSRVVYHMEYSRRACLKHCVQELTPLALAEAKELDRVEAERLKEVRRTGEVLAPHRLPVARRGRVPRPKPTPEDVVQSDEDAQRSFIPPEVQASDLQDASSSQAVYENPEEDCDPEPAEDHDTATFLLNWHQHTKHKYQLLHDSSNDLAKDDKIAAAARLDDMLGVVDHISVDGSKVASISPTGLAALHEYFISLDTDSSEAADGIRHNLTTYINSIPTDEVITLGDRTNPYWQLQCQDYRSKATATIRNVIHSVASEDFFTCADELGPALELVLQDSSRTYGSPAYAALLQICSTSEELFFEETLDCDPDKMEYLTGFLADFVTNTTNHTTYKSHIADSSITTDDSPQFHPVLVSDRVHIQHQKAQDYYQAVVKNDLDHHHHKYENLSFEASGIACSTVPIFPHRTVRLMLILFSGHRRRGDVQYYLEHLWTAEDCDLLVISLDLSVLGADGDLMDPVNKNFWLAQVHSRRACIGGISPPCETWSVARYLPLSEDRHGPPPLRSLDKPWGVDRLTHAQYQQLRTANALLFVALEFVIAFCGSGGSCYMEHPAAAVYRPQAPSIWRLPFLSKWVECTPAVELVTFNQGLHGQVSRKPTTLLLVRMKKEISSYIFRPQVPLLATAQTSLGGLDESGNFKTAIAKVYPPSMCLAIAKAAIDVVTCASNDPVVSTNEDWHREDQCTDLQPYYTPFDAYTEEGQMGRDYARHTHQDSHSQPHCAQTVDEQSAALSRRIAVNSAIAAHRKVLRAAKSTTLLHTA